MGLLDRMEKNRAREEGNPQAAAVQSESNEIFDLKNKIQDEVIEELNTRKSSEVNDGAIRECIKEHTEKLAYGLSVSERSQISEDVYNDIVGYGPLEKLLADPSISEIMINGAKKVFIEEHGKLVLSDLKFRDDQHLMNVIDRIVSSVGRHVDEASPMVDARLADGSRVNAVIPPISLVGPVLTIRRFSKTPITCAQLIEWGSISPKMAAFLEACVRGRLNIIVSGGTGSGKTTLLNVLSSFIPADERIVTVEDAAELQLHQDHVVTLESRPPNLEGRGQITIRDLVRNALRMRPDRIIVGEVRSGETLDMLQAMNTGHDGSLTTTHANSPRDTFSRLETMVLMSGMELPIKAIREQISSAIDLVVQQARMRDGTRKIVTITEVTGMEGDIISAQDIFRYETSGTMDANGKFRGEFKSTGIKPRCLDKISRNGVLIRDEWFR